MIDNWLKWTDKQIDWHGCNEGYERRSLYEIFWGEKKHKVSSRIDYFRLTLESVAIEINNACFAKNWTRLTSHDKTELSAKSQEDRTIPSGGIEGRKYRYFQDFTSCNSSILKVYCSSSALWFGDVLKFQLSDFTGVSKPYYKVLWSLTYRPSVVIYTDCTDTHRSSRSVTYLAQIGMSNIELRNVK